jgi:hypothetical protein
MVVGHRICAAGVGGGEGEHGAARKVRASAGRGGWFTTLFPGFVYASATILKVSVGPVLRRLVETRVSTGAALSWAAVPLSGPLGVAGTGDVELSDFARTGASRVEEFAIRGDNFHSVRITV